MIMFIVRTEEHAFQFHVGMDFPKDSPPIETEDVVSIEADGQEALHIKHNFKNVPYNDRKSRIKLVGEMAQNVYANL